MIGDEFRQPFALLPGSSHPWIWIPKPSESSVDKFVCGRRLAARALSVEGPAKNELRRPILFSSYPPQPTVDERGFPDTSPCDDANDVHTRVRRRSIQEREILFAPKNIAPGYRQSRDRDSLRSQFCCQPASCGVRFDNRHFPQALNSYSLPTGDSVHYHWHKLQQFGRSLEALRWVFVQQHLKQSNDRLWDILELVDW